MQLGRTGLALCRLLGCSRHADGSGAIHPEDLVVTERLLPPRRSLSPLAALLLLHCCHGG